MKIARYLAVVAAALCVTGAAHAATYYVSPAGNDANDGLSVETPFSTIQRAANVAYAGDTVYLRGGTYREQVYVPRSGTVDAPISFLAYPGETPVIKATDIVTGWTLAGDSDGIPAEGSGLIWKKTGWNYDSQQVFVDFDANPGKPLQQIGVPYGFRNHPEWISGGVGTGIADMFPGSFFYDRDTGTLYVWLSDGSDPNAHEMEAGRRSYAFFADQSFIHVSGISFRFGNAARSSTAGWVVLLGPDSVIENCDVQWGDITGIAVKNNSKILNCVIKNNGQLGIASNASKALISGNTVEYNNYRNCWLSWGGGGMDLCNFDGTIDGNTVAYNYGPGIWIDTGRHDLPVIIRNNYVHHNYYDKTSAGIFFETSTDGEIYNNVVLDDNFRGIYVAGSMDTNVYNNTVVNNASYNDVELGLRGDAYPLKNNAVTNNLISRKPNVRVMLMLPTNVSNAANNRSDYNLFYTGISWINFWDAVTYLSFPAWQTGTTLDLNSVNADPLLVSAEPHVPTDAALTELSPAIDAGTPVPGRTTDFFGNPIYGTPDIGAIEYQPPYRFGRDEPDITGNVRIYADGMFRNTSKPSGETADLSVKPAGGFLSNDHSQWLDISISKWNKSGDFSKQWTESGASSAEMSVGHTIGELKPKTDYLVTVESASAGVLSGPKCSDNVCSSNGSGTIMFTYSGDYSSVMFTVQ